MSISPSIIALDGEREVEVNAAEPVELSLSLDGSRVVNIPEVLREATAKGFFHREGK